MERKGIAFFGKSGVGTTTVAANVAAAMAETGRRIALIGCGRSADSTAPLRGGREVQTLHGALLASGPVPPEKLAVFGFKDVLCLEIGAPAMGGCSGSSFRAAVGLLNQLRILDSFGPDLVLFDVPYDTVCDGLTAVLLSGVAQFAVPVTTDDFASLRSVNDLLGALCTLKGAGTPRLAGVVANNLTGPFAGAIVEDFARWTDARVLATVPRSPVVMQSDLLGETVIESAPLALHAYRYRKLARTLLELEKGRRPRPLDPADLKEWSSRWAERIYELDGGFIREGEAI